MFKPKRRIHSKHAPVHGNPIVSLLVCVQAPAGDCQKLGHSVHGAAPATLPVASIPNTINKILTQFLQFVLGEVFRL